MAAVRPALPKRGHIQTRHQHGLGPSQFNQQQQPVPWLTQRPAAPHTFPLPHLSALQVAT